MNKALIAIIGTAAVAGGTYFAISQTGNDLELNGLEPGDKALQDPVEVSETDALTIVSLNLRDLRGRERTMEDFQELANLVDGADILVLQEMGAKGFKRPARQQSICSPNGTNHHCTSCIATWATV